MKTKFLQIILFCFVIISCSQKENKEDPSLVLLLLNLESSQITSNNSNKDCDIFENSIQQKGQQEYMVNATSTRCWVLISLSPSITQMNPGSINWDLRMRRFAIQTNSGTSGNGQGGACNTGFTNFSLVSSSNKGDCTNDENFKIDELKSQDGGGFGDFNDSVNPILFSWYTYNTAVLTAKDDVYIVRGFNGFEYKIQMTNYYSDAGTSGYPRFRYEPLN